MVTFTYKEKKYNLKYERITFKSDYANYKLVEWFCDWCVRYENEFDFLRVRKNGRLVARLATYTGV